MSKAKLTADQVKLLMREAYDFPLILRLAAKLHMAGVKSTDLIGKKFVNVPEPIKVNLYGELRQMELGLINVEPGSVLANLANELGTPKV